MPQKIRVGVLFGGESAEHEVSLQSARNVIEALDRALYEPVLIGIDKGGRWLLNEETRYLLEPDDPARISLNTDAEEAALAPGQREGPIVRRASGEAIGRLDVVFPVLHGPFGEDGTVQGLLKLAHLPFVGAGVLGSAVGMDKDVMKRLLRDAHLPIPKFLAWERRRKTPISYDEAASQLGETIFVKPANLGSSVGVAKARDAAGFERAAAQAFEFDDKIMLEEFVQGREIECAVLGDEDPQASAPGEVIPTHEFYSYEAKYLDENGAALEIPAKLDPEVAEEIRALAVRAFETLCCSGLARVDFFLVDGRTPIVNEINTLPGFTNISMYPRLWAASGVPYSELIHRLIQIAIRRYEREARLKTSFAAR